MRIGMVCPYSFDVPGGVHFTAAIVEGQKLCRPIGDLAFDFVDGHIRGQVH